MSDETAPSLVKPLEPAMSNWPLKLLASGRFQLAVALVIAVLLPGLFRWSRTNFGVAYVGIALSDPGIANGLIGSTLSCILGYTVLRQLRLHPGVTSASHIFCAFSMTYGALALALVFFRADYSRYQLAVSFVIVCGWFLVMHRQVGRHIQLRLAVISHPLQDQLPSSPKIRWLRLNAPMIEEDGVDGVVADLSLDHDPEWERFMARCAISGLAIYDVKTISEQISGRVEISHMSENTFVSTLQSLLYGKIKRIIDITGAILVAPFFLLLVIVAGILIRLEDHGPVLFRQVRMGHRGRPFVIYKLRTMTCSQDCGSAFTQPEDPRITRIGRFLRKYRVDEFPQIWNIVRGEMSWIGPRPETIDLSQWYEREVPFYSYRHMVRPGITGWAQVNQGNVAMVEAATIKLQYDFYYIKHLSPWLDLLITARTVETILTGFGAL